LRVEGGPSPTMWHPVDAGDDLQCLKRRYFRIAERVSKEEIDLLDLDLVSSKFMELL